VGGTNIKGQKRRLLSFIHDVYGLRKEFVPMTSSFSTWWSLLFG